VNSCTYPVEKGLKVQTHSDKVMQARRIVLELLLARAPEAKLIQDLARDHGVYETRFHIDDPEELCILCGLCVRVCEEKIGASAISLVGRGVERAVAAPFHMASEDCIGCGACAAVCPVGTIVVRMHEHEVEISPFKSRAALLLCAECGRPVGSELAQQVLARRGGPTLVEMLARQQLCPHCKRQKLAEELGSRGS